MIKSLLKKLLLNRGYVIKPYDAYEEGLEKVKYSWLSNLQINTVLDVGASDGGYASKARSLFPNAAILSFEPIPESYQKLISKFESDQNFKAFNVALGNTTGETEFYLNQSSGSSSILEMAELHTDSYPHTKNYSKIKVNVDTMDNVVNTKELTSRTLLKIDVQGYEETVLKGAKKRYPILDYIFTEVSFNPLYKGQMLINGVIQYLQEKGFVIAGIENVSQSLNDGTFLQADLYFKRNAPPRLIKEV